MRPNNARVRAVADAPAAFRVVSAVIVVGITASVLVGTDADLTFASIVLLLAVAGASVLGYAAGLAAALSSAALLNYYFTPPVHSFRIDQPDDFVALVAFVAVSLLVGATIARLNGLRRRAAVSAREAALRVSLGQELRRGVPVATVLQHLETELTDLLELSECTVVVVPDGALLPAAAHGEVVISTPPMLLRLVPTRVLHPDETETVTGLAAAVATQLELERIDAAAREQRVRGELDRSRAGFLTAVTHDLRTPLATIKAASAALLAPDSPLDATERRELLEGTYAEAARLEGLVNKVLELTRIRTGALTPELVAVSAADLVRIAVDRLGPTLRTRTITLDFDPELPELRVDALLMEHVLVNLLENAAVHDPSGRPIDVCGAVHGARFELRIADHGPGIPAADRERVFEEFARRRAETDGPGTGLGLAIARALVHANGGRVWCEETHGGGATFVLDLPIADDEEAPVSEVLLVEDDRMLRRALRASFRNWDFEVAEAGSGEEALSRLSDSSPDLVVLDLTLPGIDGLETLRHLRTFTDVPVVVLTVRGSLRDKVAALESGADDYVLKPFAPEELLARSRAHLRRSTVEHRQSPFVHAGALEIDLPRCRVTWRGDVVQLTPTEFRLLEVLLAHRGKLVTREQLLEEVWGSRSPSDRGRVRVFMVHLRRKLHDDAARPRLILTEPGLGYRWIAEDEDLDD